VEKSSIAKKAAQYVSDGESIIINAGTTMHAFAMHLRHRRDLQVVTNGITLVAELAHCPAAHVLLIGGETDFKKLGTVGPLAEEMIREIHVSKAFLGVSGISLDHGLLMHSPAEARINACFARAADEVTVVVDSSKFEANFIYRVAHLGDIHRLITDGKIKADARRCLAQARVELVIAEDF
jgi:DeoR/GlpR family transcriptional regulator of sugar metabolism